jgi:hypothetical protein
MVMVRSTTGSAKWKRIIWCVERVNNVKVAETGMVLSEQVSVGHG